jgi:hypothetical protein
MRPTPATELISNGAADSTGLTNGLKRSNAAQLFAGDARAG